MVIIMVNKVKVDKQWIQESADELFETGSRSDDKNLISKCLDSSDSQVSAASMIMYERINARERDEIRKSAELEMEEILRLRDEGLQNIVKMDGENPAVAEARWWNLHKELEERYSACDRIINCQ
jgi:hypothetical protein